MTRFDFKGALDDLQNFDSSELRADNIGRWPLAIRVVACMLAFIGVIVAFYFLKISKLDEQLERVTREETQLRDQFSNRAFEAANLQAYRDQLVELNDRLDTLVNQLPTETEVPGLLEDITETGLSSGLVIDSIELQSEVTHDYYIESPIAIEATGGYHDFATFISGVSGLPRIVTLHDFDISSKSNQSLLSLSITARTYRYKGSADDE